MATVRENIKNALTWFYDRLKDKYLDPFDKRISDNATNIATNTTDISGKAPTSHASSDTTYGVGTTSNYGHCRTINNLTTSSHTNGYALSAYQGYLLNSDISTANTNITKNAEDISTLNTDLTTLSTRVGYHGTYTGNIDDLHEIGNAGGYWCHSTDCSGDQPFGDSTTGKYYFLEVSYSNNGHVQRAVNYSNGAVKYRAYTNSQWYDWGDTDILLWQATSSTWTSGDQTISLNLSNWRYVRVVYSQNSSTDTSGHSIIIPVGNNSDTLLCLNFGSSSTATPIIVRKIISVSTSAVIGEQSVHVTLGTSSPTISRESPYLGITAVWGIM